MKACPFLFTLFQNQEIIRAPFPAIVSSVAAQNLGLLALRGPSAKLRASSLHAYRGFGQPQLLASIGGAKSPIFIAHTPQF